MKIEKTLVIDGHHLNREMLKLLKGRSDVPFTFLDYHTINVHNAKLGEGMFPQDLTALTELADKHDCAYIKFEKYGEVIEGLEIFDWGTKKESGKDFEGE